MNVGHGRHPGHAHMAWGVPTGPGFARGRALPIVVASGLAMGVFVGLVVVRGTGEAQGQTVAAAGGEPAASATAEPDPKAAPNPTPNPTPTPTPAANPNPTPTPATSPGPTPEAAKPDGEKKPPSMAL